MKSSSTVLQTENTEDGSSSCWLELQIYDGSFRDCKSLLKSQKSQNSANISKLQLQFKLHQQVHSLTLNQQSSKRFRNQLYQSYLSNMLISCQQTNRNILQLMSYLTKS